MNNIVLANLWRFIGLFLAQGLGFNQVSEVLGGYFDIYIYPLFILFLPILFPTSASVLLAFATGFLIDFYEGSYALHASAAAFSAFCRPIILAGFEPKGGYSGKSPVPTPEHIGWQTFIRLTAVYLFVHLFWFYSVSEFTFVYLGSILLRTLGALVISLIMSIVYMGLFRTKS